MTRPEGWRPVAAALANDDARRVWAGLVMGRTIEEAAASLSPSRRARVVGQLVAAGLVREGDDHAADGDVFRRLLAKAAPPPRPTGAERFLTSSGRVDRYPSALAEREELLRLVAARAMSPGETVAEPAPNERLRVLADDVALLRRHLVDHGILERARDGSSYRLTD
ncbi:DUF2087 domain-containing protein [Microbacterium betulae]|uniref:DUF2087 domain-containing protein n=1 Tax=Microbacterium betulae TaxID=2981139 RepID=A0AA97I6E0_9MICO|nr:DUF2087 domain-containing protein [Microbacterium sp. AB]WOF23759.1 DUF2087 domain-containing protein [Microbacterium sp. AB]